MSEVLRAKWFIFSLLVITCASATVFTGCGSKNGADTASAPIPRPAPKPTPAADATPDAAATPAPAPPTASAPGAVAAPAPADPVNDDPTSVPAILRALNLAVHQYADPNTRPNADSPAAQKIYPPIKDLSDVVKAGFIKEIPPAPAGKQYKLDKDKLEVTLVDK